MSFSRTLYAFLQQSLPPHEQAVWEETLMSNPEWRAALHEITRLLQSFPELKGILLGEKPDAAASGKLQTAVEELHKQLHVLSESVTLQEEDWQEALRWTRHNRLVEDALSQLDMETMGEGKTTDKSINPLVPFWRQRWLYGVAAMLVVGFGLFWYMSLLKQEQPKYDNDYFASTYFAEPYAASAHMGEADSLQKATELYNQENYAQAQHYLLNISPPTAHTQLMLANCYMKQQQFGQAIPLLERAAENPDYKAEALKYTLICYILTSQDAKALSLIDIHRESLPPAEKALFSKIREELNSKQRAK